MPVDEESIFAFIKENLMEIKDIEAEELQIDSSLESLGLDSLDFVSMQLSIRKKYGVSLDEEVFASGQITTMRQLAAYVAAEVRSKKLVLL